MAEYTKEIKINGLADLQKILSQIPVELETKIMRGALRAGCNVIKDAAVALAPDGPPSATNVQRYGGYMGALKDSIRVTTRKEKFGRIMATVRAGGRTKRGADVFYAHWVEYGTEAHQIPKRADIRQVGGVRRKLLSFAGIFRHKVWHPGTKGKKFMRPAMDNNTQKAVIAVGAYIKKRLASKTIQKRFGLSSEGIWVFGDE